MPRGLVFSSAFGLEIRVADDDGVRIIEAQGDIDLASSRVFQDALSQLVEDGPPSAVIVDLSRVQYLDLSGIQVLERVNRFVRDHARPLLMIASSYPVHRILELSGMNKRIQAFESVEKALAFLKPAPGA